MEQQVIDQEPSVADRSYALSAAEDRESRIAARKARIEEAQARLRPFATPGRLMSDELIEERREEARREEAEL